MKVQIACPSCRKSFLVVLADMVPGASRPCPNCGARIKFAGTDASKMQDIIGKLGSVPGVKVNVTVRQKSRPWWRFWV